MGTVTVLLVSRNVHDATDDINMSGQVCRELSKRNLYVLQSILHILWPLLHQTVNVRHGLAVVDGWSWFAAMEVTE